MRLAKLTGLGGSKSWKKSCRKRYRRSSRNWNSILASKPKRTGDLMKDELATVVQTFGDERRTTITADEGEFTVEDLFADEEMVVTISHSGYIKRTSITTYHANSLARGGKGLQGSDLKAEDFIEHLFVASTHDYILVFTQDGRCFWLKVHEVPLLGRATKGKPIVNLINVSPDTTIAAMVPVKKFYGRRVRLLFTRATAR